MQILKDAIRPKGKAINQDVLLVDSFLMSDCILDLRDGRY